MSKKHAEAIAVLRLDLSTKRGNLARAADRLERIMSGKEPGSVRIVDEEVYRLSCEVDALTREIERKTARFSVSPKLAAALTNPAHPQKRFWTYNRKDMYK